MSINLAGIVNDSITDGPGIRLTIFAQGCVHHCEGCHNPQTHSFEGGTEYSAEQIFERVQKNPLLSGVTYSGGEPFCQAKGFVELSRLIRERTDLNIFAYTGYTFEQLVAENDPDKMELLSMCDVLVDGRFVLAERSLALKFRGSRNQRVLDVKKSLESGFAVETTDEAWL